MDRSTEESTPTTHPSSGPLFMLATRSPRPVRDVAVSLAERVPTLDVGRTVVAVLGGAVLALVLAVPLGRLRTDVAGSIGALSLVLVLLFIAAWDLLVRWGLLQRQPLLVGSGPQTGAARLLRPFASWMILVAGILVGHVAWR
jgi:predicted MFS family arabinose efflux permease